MKAHSNNAKESDIAQYCKDFYNQIKEEQHNVTRFHKRTSPNYQS